LAVHHVHRVGPLRHAPQRVGQVHPLVLRRDDDLDVAPRARHRHSRNTRAEKDRAGAPAAIDHGATASAPSKIAEHAPSTAPSGTSTPPITASAATHASSPIRTGAGVSSTPDRVIRSRTAHTATN